MRPSGSCPTAPRGCRVLRRRGSKDSLRVEDGLAVPDEQRAAADGAGEAAPIRARAKTGHRSAGRPAPPPQLGGRLDATRNENRAALGNPRGTGVRDRCHGAVEGRLGRAAGSWPMTASTTPVSLRCRGAVGGRVERELALLGRRVEEKRPTLAVSLPRSGERDARRGQVPAAAMPRLERPVAGALSSTPSCIRIPFGAPVRRSK